MAFTSNRRFRLWDYNVSHKQMLLRSPKTSTVPTNLDVVMWDVEYLECATTLDGLAILEPSNEDLERVEQALGKKADPSRVVCFASSDRRFIVVAAGFKVLENDLDIFESSLEYFAGSDPVRNLGEALAHS